MLKPTKEERKNMIAVVRNGCCEIRGGAGKPRVTLPPMNHPSSRPCRRRPEKRLLSALQHLRQARHDVQCQRRQVRPLRRRRPAGHPPPQRPRRNPRLHRLSRPRVRLIRARDAPQSRRFRRDRRLFYIHCILPAQGCVTSCFGPQPSSARRTRNGVS